VKGVTIQSAGIAWSLDAYIDAHAYQRFSYDCDGHYLPPFSHADQPGTAILPDGQIVKANGRDLPWTTLVAFRAQDGASARCDWCGEFYSDCDLFITGAGESACGDCLACAEPA
jgi:hypothetical protein